LCSCADFRFFFLQFRFVRHVFGKNKRSLNITIPNTGHLCQKRFSFLQLILWTPPICA
jgi:hypothetical protein